VTGGPHSSAQRAATTADRVAFSVRELDRLPTLGRLAEGKMVDEEWKISCDIWNSDMPMPGTRE
jgi:hypothetical protein